MGEQSIPYDLGPVIMNWNAVDIGPNFGTVTFHDEQLVAPVKEEQQGDIPVDEVTTGILASVESPMSRLTLAELEVLMRGTTNPTATSILQKNQVGESLYEDAKELILKPAVNGAAVADTDKWLYIFKTYPIIMADVVYDNAGQRVWLVKWSVYPVRDSGATFNDLFRWGPVAP